VPAQGPAGDSADDTEPAVRLALLVPADDVLAVCDGFPLVDAGWLDDDDAFVAFGFDEVAGAAVGRGAVLPQLPVGVAVAVTVTVTRGAGVRVCVFVTVTVGLAVTVTVLLGLAVPVALLLTDAVLWTAGGVELLDFFTVGEADARELAVADGHVVTGAGPVVWPDAVPASEPAPASPWLPPPGFG